MNVQRLQLPNQAPLIAEDFQNIIEPLPLPSQLPVIQMPRRQQVTPLPTIPMGHGSFIPPPRFH